MRPSVGEREKIDEIVGTFVGAFIEEGKWYSTTKEPIQLFVSETTVAVVTIKNIAQGIGSFFSSKPDELHDFQPTSHATCMKGLGENISNVQKGSTSLTDKLSVTNSDQSHLADDSAKLIEAQSNTIKESISLASENAQTITHLQNELFTARRELLAIKLLKSPENMQAMQVYMASIAEKISTYEKVEGKLFSALVYINDLKDKNKKVTDCAVALATQNKSQKEKIADLEQGLSSHSPRGAI